MTLWIALVLVTIAAAAAALWIHHLFEGEWLPSDLWREWRLSRLCLPELDRRWSAAPDRSDIVISLTTTPSRIALIDTTLKSLLDQDLAPASIVLNIPLFSKREQVAYHLPVGLTELKSIRIQRCDDLGPATKLIPTLQSQDPDTPILVVDDDRIYPPWLVSRYAVQAAAYPDRAAGMSGWIVPKDLTDRFTTILSNLLMLPPAPIRAPRLKLAREIDVLQGVTSYLVRPRFFDLAEMLDTSQEPSELFFVDDVRTSALCKVGKWVFPAPSLSFMPWRSRAMLQKTRLARINSAPDDVNLRSNTIAIRYFKDRWRVGGPAQSNR